MVTAKAIYDGLKDLGLTRAQARRLLPAWWSPDMEQSRDGVAEMSMLLSRRLHLDLKQLANGKVQRRDQHAPIAYKHTADTDPSTLEASTGIARALAQAVLAASPVKQREFPSNPSDFAAFTKDHGKGSVGLASLVDACWSMGVPVIPMPNLPVGIRKMDGAVVRVDGGDAIIVSRKKSSRAWLAFILSHEIGHLACGHLQRSGSIVDVSLQESSTYATESSADQQENEADQYALALMGGKRVDQVIAEWPERSSPTDLAVEAKTHAPECEVEPGHLVLRFAFKTKRWTESVMALNYLREDANADIVMNAALKKHLDFDRVSEDMSDFVRQTTGLT